MLIIVISPCFQNFRFILLTIYNLISLLLEVLDDFLIEMELFHGHTVRMLFEADLVQVSKHNAPLNLLDSFTFEALKTLIGLLNIFEEENIGWIKLQCVYEVNLGLFDLTKVIACLASATNTFDVSWIELDGPIGIIVGLHVRFELQVGLGSVG